MGFTGGAVIAAALFGMGAARADDGTDEINSWTVTPTSGSDVDDLLPPATLSDPSDSLGLGTAPIAGGFESGFESTPPLSDIGTNEVFFAPQSTTGSPDNLFIQDLWFPGIESASVQAGNDNVQAFLVPTLDGKQVVDLFNFSFGDAAPLFNPDATGPIDVGGVELASPQDGALLNDLSDAIFTGNAADWTNAMTLFDDYLGIAPSAAADAVDLGSLLP